MSQLELEEIFLDGLECLEYGNVVEAKKKFEEVLASEPGYGRVYNYLGWIYHKYFYDYATAEKMYNAVLRLSPEFPPVYLNYICLLTETDKWEHLRYILEKAVKIPGVRKSQVWFYYGRLFEHNENYEIALEYYAKGVKAETEENDLRIFRESIERCKLKHTQADKWISIIA